MGGQYEIVIGKGYRYVVCLNEEEAKKDKAARMELLKMSLKDHLNLSDSKINFTIIYR
jgi:triosephosphate isomerase